MKYREEDPPGNNSNLAILLLYKVIFFFTLLLMKCGFSKRRFKMDLFEKVLDYAIKGIAILFLLICLLAAIKVAISVIGILAGSFIGCCILGFIGYKILKKYYDTH